MLHVQASIGSAKNMTYEILCLLLDTDPSSAVYSQRTGRSFASHCICAFCVHLPPFPWCSWLVHIGHRLQGDSTGLPDLGIFTDSLVMLVARRHKNW